jgi:O-antigen ligase
MRFIKKNVLNYKNKKYFIITILTWVSLWLSLGSYPSDIFGKDINSIINGLRSINALAFSLVLFFFILTLYIKNFPKIKIKIFNIFILFSLLFSLQFIGLYQNNSINFTINIIFLPIFAITILILIFLIKFYEIKNIEKYLLYFSIFFIFAFTLVILLLLRNEINIIEKKYLYRLVPLDMYFLNNTLPRITGISRSVAILNIFLIICLFFLVKKNIHRIAIIILAMLFSLALWIFQSRGAILCFVVVNIFILFFTNRKLLKLFFIFIIFIVPVMTYETYFFIFKKNLNLINYNNEMQLNNGNINDKIRIDEEKRIAQINTSGRTELWKLVIKNYDKNKIFGYGPQADRYLIFGDMNKQYGNNVSNSLLYSFVCGGYFSLFIFLLILIKLFIYLYKIIFIYKIFYIKNFITEKISVSFILFFIVRSVFENSFAVFSIDYLIFIISLFIIDNFLKKNN